MPDDTRVYQILRCLIDIRSTAASRDLARRAGLSESTLFRNIPSVEAYVAPFGLRISRVRGKGYGLVGQPAQIDELRRRLEESSFYPLYSSGERKALVFVNLLEAGDKIKLHSMGMDLKLSDSTISKCIKEIEADLAASSVRIDRRQGSGTTLGGEERAIRSVAMRYISSAVDNNELLSMALSLDEEKPSEAPEAPSAAAHIFRFMRRNLPLGTFLRGLSAIEGHENPFLDDASVLILLQYLSIASLRIRQGEIVQRSPSPGSPGEDSARRILSAAGVDPVPEGEAELLQSLLAGLEALGGAPGQDPCLMVAEDFIHHFEYMLGASAFSRDMVVELLGRSLAALRVQKIHSFVFSMPIGRGHGKYSPKELVFFNLAANLIRKSLDISISIEEVAALADLVRPAMTEDIPPVRAVIVCASGIGTSFFLQQTLEAQVKELRIVGTVPARGLTSEYLKRQRIDLVVSTVRLEECVVPCFCIDLPLHDSHISALKTRLENMRRSSEEPETNDSPDGLSLEPVPRERDKENARMLLSDFLRTNRTVAARYKAEDWVGAVRKATSLLESCGVVESRYFSEIVRITNEHGPYYVIAPGIAMPHARPEDGARETGFSLITLDQPVSFGNAENDPVDVILCLAARSKKDLNERAIVEAMSLFENEEQMRRLREAKTDEELLAGICEGQ